jgi:hypothetical protein
MEGIGLLVVIAFMLLILAIFTSTCSDWRALEGFEDKRVPKKTSLTDSGPKGATSIADLPGAPVTGLADTNSLPFQDPVLEKSSKQQLNELKQDMDGFSAFELPGLDDKSDPAVKLPITRFKGDYQRVKDELSVVSRTPGLQPQLTIEDINDMAANLRFLQRTYRLYAYNQLVPEPKSGLTKVGTTEGFEDAKTQSTPITPDQLKILQQKIGVEMIRLQASGTTDPIIQARVGILTKMKQSIDDMVIKIQNGSLKPSDIPIMKEDYEKFLPELGKVSSDISGITSSSGKDTGDFSSKLFDKYASELIKGLSFKISYSYTSPAEIAKTQALATVATGHPGTTKGARGEFDQKIREMDLAGFQNNMDASNGSVRPPSEVPFEAAHFDWKKRVEDIQQNIRRSGMNPRDFGALAAGASVGKDFSWRGHAKMMCSRLATVNDPATPEQMGCPPVSWKGWRL